MGYKVNYGVSIILIGISFYKEIGFLSVGPKFGKYIESVKDVARNLNISVETFSSPAIKDFYPYLNFKDYNEFVLTRKKAGHISPRKLVRAQKKIAAKQGCDIIDDVACGLDSATTLKRHIRISTDSGRLIKARKVLIATGAFTMHRTLIQQSMQPEMKYLSQTVVKVYFNKKALLSSTCFFIRVF